MKCGARFSPALILAAAAALALAMGIGRFSYTLILPLMAATPGFTTTAAALLASANYAGYLAGAIVAGLPVLYRRSRALLIVALFTSALTSGGMALTHDIGVWSLLRFMSGVASAFAFVYASALVMEHVRIHEKPFWSAVFFTGVGAGIALSAILIDAIKIDTYEQAWATMAAASFALLCLIVPQVARKSIHPGERSSVPEIVGGSKSLVSLALIYCAYFAESIGYIIPATFIVYFVSSVPALVSYRNVIWLIVGIAAIPSTMVWGRVSARLGNLPTACIAMSLQTAGVVIDLLFPSLFGAVALAASLGATFVGITLLVVRSACSISPAPASSTLARLTVVFGVGQILGPLLAAAARHSGGHPQEALRIAALVLAIGTLLLFVANALAAKAQRPIVARPEAGH